MPNMAMLRTAGLLKGLRTSQYFQHNRLAVSALQRFSTTPNNSNGNGNGKLHKRPRDTADTLIIGGGCVGVSTAYHLAKAGMKDVVLLEKTELTAGSTWHAAGLTAYFHPGINVKNLHYYSIKLFETLGEETGQQIGFHNPGSIRLAATPQRVDEFKYQMQRAGWNKPPQRLMEPDEIAKMHPLLNMDGILLGMYNPDDGHIDPYSLTQAYAAGARKYGAEIYQNSPVTGLKQTSDGKWEVETQHGTIKANRVINAGGFWSREIGEMTGLEVPMMTMQHQYIVTTTIPELKDLGREVPVVRDLKHSYYVRQERSGLLVGPYENHHNLKQQTEWLKGVPQGFGRELFESDLDRISDHLEAAMELIPVLQTADIQTTVCGPYPYSSDALGIAGPYPGIKNYWIINGCSGGIVWSGGLGKYLTEWILSGEPPHDLVELDPARYGKWLTKEYLTAKTRETYSMNTALVYPFEERQAGRPTHRVSGAYEKMMERGAQYGFKSGWEQPNWFALPGDDSSYKPSFRRTNWFEPVGRECRMVRERAGVIDLSSFGKFEVQGKDAVKLMDYLTAGDLPQIGQYKTLHMLTPSGKIYAELVVCRTADDSFFCVNSASAELFDIRWIEEHAFNGGFNVTVSNITEDKACLGIAGPKSRQILQELTNTDLSDKTITDMSTKTLDIAGTPVFLIVGSSTGELGYELYHDKEYTEKLYTALLTAGEQYGVGDYGSYAANILRMEVGKKSFGRELTVDYNPYEARMESYINPNKEADFIGKTALPKLKDTLNRRLALMSVDCSHDNKDPTGYETVWYNGQAVGNTTSGGYSSIAKQSIAYAYLPLDLTFVGSQVQVELLGGHYTGTVIPDPLVLDEKKRRQFKQESSDFSDDDDNHFIPARRSH